MRDNDEEKQGRIFQIRRILVPVDFSEGSRCALAFAARLGSSANSEEERPKLQIVHGVKAFGAPLRRVLFPYAPLGEDDRELEAEVVEAAREEVGRYFSLDEREELRLVGPPVVEVIPRERQVGHWLEGLDSDLIAMGAFGEGGAFCAGPGSTARRVVAGASQPVALLRSFDPGATIRRVLVAWEPGHLGERVMEVGMRLAFDLDAPLSFLHVFRAPRRHSVRWNQAPWSGVKREELREQLGLRLRALFEESLKAVDLPYADEGRRGEMSELTLEIGEPADRIGEVAQQEGADLVVVGRGGSAAERTGRVGPVASAVMARVPRHVVVVPGRLNSESLLD